jgi:hypothetical protein
VVHTGCTTGLEAILMDKAVVNLMPSDHPVFDRIVNWANPTFRTWQDAADAIRLLFLENGGPILHNHAKYDATLNQYLPGYREGNAAKAIATSIGAALRARGAMPEAGFKWQPRPPGFKPFPRTEVLKAKMTATQDEFIAGLKSAQRLTGVSRNVQVGMIDESLFLAVPA